MPDRPPKSSGVPTCRWCGLPLDPTPTGRTSRAAYHPVCRVRVWIEADRDRARQLWAKVKRAQRARTASK